MTQFGKKAIALVAVSMVAIGVRGATDGVADDAQSVATINVSIGSAVARQIRVFGVKDALMLSDAGIVENGYGFAIPGVQDGFCVADNSGGAVKIKFASAGIAAGTGDILLAKSATTGTDWEYHQAVSINNGTWQKVGEAGNTEYVVPTGTTQTDLITCAAPNVRKSIVNRAGVRAPINNVYSDVMTITATPL